MAMHDSRAYHSFERRWLTQTAVYETKGVSPYIGWLRFIGLEFRVQYIQVKEYVNQMLAKAVRYPHA